MTPALGLHLGSDPFAHGALTLERYLQDVPAIPATLQPPAASTYPWGVLANDRLGDCVEAALYHADESLYLRRGLTPYPYQAPECIELYSALTGYNPDDPSTDQGTDPSQAMAWWRDKGLPGHKLAGFAQLPADSPHIRRAIWEFGAVIYAVALPVEAQSQGVHWRGSQGTPGSWGGHGIAGNSYTPDLLGFVSWGAEGDMSNDFAGAFLEQVFVPLSHDALNSAKVGPAGFDFATMRADLGAL